MNKFQKINSFFEEPKGTWAFIVQAVILLLVLISVGISVVDFFYPVVYRQHLHELNSANNIILIVFTIEYLLRLISSKEKLKFIRKPMNIVDFFAIFPNYIELVLPFFVNTEELRVLRLIRLLRFARLLRAFKLFEYRRLIEKVFVLQDTILEAIFPVLLIFASIKCLIWLFESNHWWFVAPDLSNLFATIGFALGIILSQKIGVSYNKFQTIEETILRIYSNLRSLSSFLGSNSGKKAVSSYAKSFIQLLGDSKSSNFLISSADDKLYREVLKKEKEPGDLAMLCGEISRDVAHCLSKKTRLTPKAYDVLLHQVTILYLILVAMFVPGVVGLASVLITTYMLYGMYELTEDLDSILGGQHNLINVGMEEIKSLANL